jgi:hypothetical protein
MGRKAEDLTGQRFGRLTAMRRVATENREPVWACVCDCGSTTDVASSKLRSGWTRSCGCLRRETVAATGRRTSTTHGRSHDPEYHVWRSMIARCENPKNIGYANYGGRGIKVCREWRESFEAFIKDMGDRPEGMEIDRKNSDGPYEPGNCRWATSGENTRNRRVTPMYTHQGRTMALGAWAEATGIPYRILKDRVRKNWAIERALTTPPPMPRETQKNGPATSGGAP